MKRIKVGILAAAALCVLLLLWYGRQPEQEIQTTAQRIYVQIETTRQVSSTVEARVDFWLNETDGNYYVFLPSSADRKRMYLQTEGIDFIAIDDKTLHSGDRMELTPGEYELTIGQEPAGRLVVMQSENIGSIFVETKSGTLDYLMADKENREEGEILILDEEMTALYKGELEFLKGRGNSSWSVIKPSFRLKFRDKTDVYGMGAARSWNMIPNAEDKTMLRNATIYSWADLVGLSYSPQYRMVDWYINGDYRGTYQIVESIGVNEERVAIADLEEKTGAVNQKSLERYGRESLQAEGEDLARWYRIPVDPEDISGGYLLEQEISDRYNEDPYGCGFLSERNQNVVLKSPKYASYDQVMYIRELYQQMEDAVFSENGYNMETGLHYSDYLDVDSFARKYLIEEISKNLDAASTSQYLYKDSNAVSTKIFSGPVWDYDKSLGNGGVRDNIYFLNEPEDIYAAIAPGKGVLWKGLYAQPDFYRYVCEVFRSSYLPSLEEINNQITENSRKITASAMMNAYRWNVFEEAGSVSEKEAQYRAEVEGMRTFLNERCAWLAAYWQ